MILLTALVRMVEQPLLALLLDLATSQRIVVLVHREDLCHSVLKNAEIKVERLANGLCQFFVDALFLAHRIECHFAVVGALAAE